MEEALAQLGHAQELANKGQFAAVVGFLSAERRDILHRSPTLALLRGIAHARLGDYERGRAWVVIALDRSRETADGHVEARALNVLGAIAFERGTIDEAERHFSQGLEAAKQIDDTMTLGRCANNLGILANLLGGADTNMGISYRDHGDYTQALAQSDRAVHAASITGDPVLVGQAWAGRAEIRVRAGDAPLARREAETALTMHRKINDPIGEMEDLRILALTLNAGGERAGAERVLQDVIDRAEAFHRPLLAANAGRDLAHVLHEQERTDEMKEIAHQARARFVELGAMGEARRLDELIGHRW